MGFREEYITAGATAIITQEGEYLLWAFDQGGVLRRGRTPIGDDSLSGAVHRARVEIDAAALAPPPKAAEPLPGPAPAAPKENKQPPATEKAKDDGPPST